LANAEDTTEGLLFNRGVPPWIDDDDSLGHSEVETDAAALEGGEENAHLACRLLFKIIKSFVAGVMVFASMV
jgi:hypothetical protein